MKPSGEWITSAGARRWVGVSIFIALTGTILWLATRSDRGTSGPRAADLRSLPAFSLRGFDGGRVTHRALLGKPAVINFFASTCSFCIREMPAFERVHDRSGDSVVFLGVALRDSEPAARALAKETGVTYRLALDDSGSFYRELRGFGMPVTVFVLPDGLIASTHSGPLDERALQQQIDDIVASDRSG